jgi:hypothetical protein
MKGAGEKWARLDALTWLRIMGFRSKPINWRQLCAKH